ncbi:reverse transcriptase domain-containing protein [Tanacetum coccineum]
MTLSTQRVSLIHAELDENSIGKILSGSPCLETLELNCCHFDGLIPMSLFGNFGVLERLSCDLETYKRFSYDDELVGDEIVTAITELDEGSIGKILSGSPCLETLQMKGCCGFRRWKWISRKGQREGQNEQNRARNGKDKVKSKPKGQAKPGKGHPREEEWEASGAANIPTPPPHLAYLFESYRGITMADNRTMAQLLEAPTKGYEDAIVVLEITANNFEIKHGLLNLVQTNVKKHQIFGHDKEDPHAPHPICSTRSSSTMKFPERLDT